MMVANIYPNTLSTGGGTPCLQNSAAAPLKCPRCDSANTKFCYYNNYSLAQPRHFCKACKRYWTRGGTLRNVPVGGGCRKNKRQKKPQSTAASPKAPLRRPANSLPTLPPPSADLSSLIYGVPPINLSNLFFPRFNLDAQLASFEETFQSGIGSNLVDLQQSAAAGESYQAPLLSYDDLPTGICEGLSLIKENPMESIYPFGGSGSAAAESAYLYGWPESCSSVVPLL